MAHGGVPCFICGRARTERLEFVKVNLPYLSIIVPAYNEQSRIENSLRRIQEYINEQTYDAVVLVVSDGSTDETVDIVQSFSAQDSRFQVYHYSPNRGKGCAVRTGMLMSEAEWLLLCDADLAAPIEEVEKLFSANTPIAIGSRALNRRQMEIKQPFLRRTAGKMFNFVVQLLAIRGLQDTQCGFKLFSNEAAKAIFSRCRLDGYSYDFEALMIGRALGYAISEVPIRWEHQEGSKVNLLRDGLKMIKDLVILRLTFSSRMKPKK